MIAITAKQEIITLNKQIKQIRQIREKLLEDFKGCQRRSRPSAAPATKSEAFLRELIDFQEI